jgi:holo-[acyl-carrier protein] synthase
MIIGLGSDIVHINRIEKLIEEFGERFINRSYTDYEIEGAKRFGANNNMGRASYFARRFAAKEAAAKALGTGFRDGLRFEHIGVENDELGKPHLVLNGKAADMLDSMAPAGKKAVAHMTLCDDYPIAQAIVVIEAV